MTTKRKWDLGDEEVVVAKPARPLRVRNKCIATSAIKVIFSVLTVTQSAVPSNAMAVFSSSPDAVVQVVRVARKDLQSGSVSERWNGAPVDTKIGMSVTKLSEVFPKLFKPDTDESVDGEEFFLS